MAVVSHELKTPLSTIIMAERALGALLPERGPERRHLERIRRASERMDRLVSDLLSLGYVPVVASVGVSADGGLLNVNADTLAAHLAKAAGATRLIIAGKTAGVFDAWGRTCARLDPDAARAMVTAGTARDGMVAKLTACLDAIAGGVSEVRIVDGRGGAFDGAPGTTISVTPEYSRC